MKVCVRCNTEKADTQQAPALDPRQAIKKSREPSPQWRALLDRVSEVERRYMDWESLDVMASALSVHRMVLSKFIQDAIASGLIAQRTGRRPHRPQMAVTCPPDPELTDEQKARIRALAERGLPWAGPAGVSVKAGIPARAWTEAYGIYSAMRGSL